MFESHEEHTSHLARQRAATTLQICVKIHQAGPDTVLEIEDR